MSIQEKEAVVRELLNKLKLLLNENSIAHERKDKIWAYPSILNYTELQLTSLIEYIELQNISSNTSNSNNG